MVFNRHLKALNLCNHSDTIACVLYELLVKFGIDYCEFPKLTSRFHKFQFCSIFKVLLGCCVFRNSLYIIYQKRLIVKRFSESFFEEVFFKKRVQAVDRRACRGFRRGTAWLWYHRRYGLSTGFYNFFRIFLLLVVNMPDIDNSSAMEV